MKPTKTIALFALASALQLVPAAVRAAAYSFTGYENSDVTFKGGFETGAMSPVDPGYYLLTSMTFTYFVDHWNTVHLANLTTTEFFDDVYAAFNPATQRFISHWWGYTFPDIGGDPVYSGELDGVSGLYNIGPGIAGSDAGIYGDTTVWVHGWTVDFFSHYNNFHAIAITPPPSVPEPATWAMVIGGFGLVGGVMRSRHKAAATFA